MKACQVKTALRARALFKLYERLARGGVGLIITGYANVSQDGMSPFYGMQAMDRDELIGKYRELVDLVHVNGARIAMQIVHCGRQTFEDRYIDIGISSKGRILVVWYTERNDNIRIIGCRRANRFERDQYEKE